MFFKKKQNNSGIEKAAMALAAAVGVAHAAFFAVFVWRVIGRDGLGTFGWGILAAVAALGMGLNMLGYMLIKRGDGAFRRWGFTSVAASTLLAGILLGISSWVA